MAAIIVRLLAGDDGEESRKMLRDFSSEIARLDGVKPSAATSFRGDPVTLGAIALAAVKSGALTALINLIVNYLNRDRRNEIEFSTANGEKIRVSSPCDLTDLEGTVRRLFPVIDDRRSFSGTDDWPSRKVAILVANDKFENAGLPDLLFTQNDASELKTILEDKVCGFETHLYPNQSSYRIRAELNRICRDLSTNDILLFYYAGHGKLDGNELCLITNDTIPESLDATSIKAEQDVLRYFNRTLSKRKVMILDCCYAGAVADGSRGNDLDGALESLRGRYGTYILTAASERAYEIEGHGVFTKALLDCFQKGGKYGRESLTITDINIFVKERLRGLPQTPLLKVIEPEGDSFEIGNYRQRIEERKDGERKKTLEKVKIKLAADVATDLLTDAQRSSILTLFEGNEETLLRWQREDREVVRLYVEGKKSFNEFYDEVVSRPLTRPQLPEPPIKPREQPIPPWHPPVKPPPPPDNFLKVLILVGATLLLFLFMAMYSGR